jgi:hypothetical protein
LSNLKWLKWAVARHLRQRGYTVTSKSIRAGNAATDGEVVGGSWRLALELKSSGDDLIRGVDQLMEALCNGYSQGAMVTTMRRAKSIKPEVFDRTGLILLGVDSQANVHQVYPTYASPEAERLG